MAKRNCKALVIVESPAKARTINKYLGPDFEVQASMGHVRDLPSKGMNVDIENNFEPHYDIMPGKKRTVNSLKSAAKRCDALYLATDLDREGEAIAWHLAQLLGKDEDKTYRVIFNAITKQAIEQAFASPAKLDMNKVMAQQARRILDRIVGYQISPLLWKKVARGLSAGRVQSVAVKIIVEKERLIRDFKPQEYWLIPAVFSVNLDADYSDQWQKFITPKDENDKGPTLFQQYQWLADRGAFKADLVSIDGKKYKAENQEQAHKIYHSLQNADFRIDDIATRLTTSRPSPPFITSTLQQAAASRLGYSTKRTMRIAQQLYEGVDLGSMGSLGLITYMRTDSTHLAGQAIAEARKHIARQFGDDYVPEKPNFYSSKKGAQQAHEAIRPTDVDYSPEEIGQFLTDEQYKLYDLIWRRFVACQMAPGKWNVTTVSIGADTAVGHCVYRAIGRVQVFDGFTRVWPTSSNQQQLPAMDKAQPVKAVDITAEQKFTKPPARYTEGSLVKELEKEGIGRPSTYSSIISTIQDRNYVEQRDGKLFATDLGEVVTDKLSGYFPNVMSIPFTRDMEARLDKIEENDTDWLGVLKDFYVSFKENLENAQEQMVHAKAETTPSEYTCPECGRELVYRFGKKGRFLSCAGYPDCKYAVPCDRQGKMVEEKVTEHKCPNCSAAMVEKLGRFGKFLGCSNYPECKTILNLDREGNVLPPKPPAEPTGITCHKCKKGELVIRQSKRGPFMGCNRFPRCRTIVSIKQKESLLQLQSDGKWPPETLEEADQMLGRKKTKKTKKAVKKKKAAKKKTTKKKTAKKKSAE